MVEVRFGDTLLAQARLPWKVGRATKPYKQYGLVMPSSLRREPLPSELGLHQLD